MTLWVGTVIKTGCALSLSYNELPMVALVTILLSHLNQHLTLPLRHLPFPLSELINNIQKALEGCILFIGISHVCLVYLLLRNLQIEANLQFPFFSPVSLPPGRLCSTCLLGS